MARRGGGFSKSALPAALLALAALPGGAAWAQDYVDVFNQQSYPTVGQTWTVEFEAGRETLRVSGYGGTVLGDGPGADVSFEYLEGPDGARLAGTAGDNWVEFEGFGPGAGRLAVHVKTSGAHHLRLESGSASSSAHNWAYPELASKIPGVLGGAPSLPSNGQFGKSISRIGDVDGDGVQDVAVGAKNASGQSSDRGAVHVLFMNSDGSVKKTAEINSTTPNGPSLADGDEFGTSVAGIGDVNGDGVPDMAVGAKSDDAGGDLRGTVHVIMLHPYGGPKKTAEINSTTQNGPSLEDGDLFGTSVAGIGDIDGDGVDDIAVGATGDDVGLDGSSGAVHVVFMNSDGTAKMTAEIDLSTTNGPLLTTFDFLGSSVAGLGDMNGDRVPDIVAGATGDDAGGPGRGALHVMYLNSDGTVQRTAEINSTNGPILVNYDELGHSVAAIGDIDGDGVADIAAGTPLDGTGGTNTGTVHLFLMNSNGTVKRAAEINSTTANGPSIGRSDQFGSSVSGMQDIDGDGVPDIVAGSSGQGLGLAGTMYVVFLESDLSVKRTVVMSAGAAASLSLSAGDDFGKSAARVGDLDGDGTYDVAVGARFDDAGGSDRGAVHLLFMSPSGAAHRTAEINSTTQNGPSLADRDWFGTSAAGIGDLDRDGVPDIAVGAPGDDAGGNNRGAVHILFLNSDGTVKRTAEINSSTTNGPSLANSDEFGASAAGIGDLDRDGVPDIAVGAPGDDAGGSDRGAVHVLFLNSDGTVKRTAEINSTNGPSLANSDEFGASAAGIGDLDRDGVPDIAVGAPGDDAGGNNRGAVHILFLNSDGTVQGTAEINSSTANGPSLADRDVFGASVAGIGDVDGDGVPDIAAGAAGDDAGGNNRGAVHILFLNPDGTAKQAAELSSSTLGILGLQDSDRFGASVALLGDIDRDGEADLVAGARSAGPAGTLYVIRLEAIEERGSGLAKKVEKAANSTSIQLSSSPGDQFGRAAANVGDLNGDGFAELAVGAPYADGGGADRGAVTLVFTKLDGTVRKLATIGSSTANGPSIADNDEFGTSVAGIGDLDGDGVPDMAVGARGDDAGGSWRGAVHILYMNSDGTVKRTAEINSTTQNGPSLADDDTFGTSVAGVGDLDGDGVADIAAGAPKDEAGGSGRGALHVMFLNSDGTVKRTAEINSSTPNGPSLADNDNFATSAAGIGDLDGDGVPDIAAGAWGDDAGGSQRGAVHVLYMNSDGTVKRTAEINSTTQNGPSLSDGDFFGYSVAAAGDLDGDGVPDVAAGAVGNDVGGNTRGALHVMFLNSDGTVKRTAEINSTTQNGPSLSGADFFGSSAAALGDLDGDGVPEMAAGAERHDAGSSDASNDTGAVYIVFMETDGSPKRTAMLDDTRRNGPLLDTGDDFGAGAAGVGDVDRDGVPDLAVGAPGDDGGGRDRGAVRVLFMDRDGTVASMARIGAGTPSGPSLADFDQFGSSVAGVGDLDRDGVPDVAAGAIGDNAGGGGAFEGRGPHNVPQLGRHREEDRRDKFCQHGQPVSCRL